jgi:hypothetical protein
VPNSAVYPAAFSGGLDTSAVESAAFIGGLDNCAVRPAVFSGGADSSALIPLDRPAPPDAHDGPAPPLQHVRFGALRLISGPGPPHALHAAAVARAGDAGPRWSLAGMAGGGGGGGGGGNGGGGNGGCGGGDGGCGGGSGGGGDGGGAGWIVPLVELDLLCLLLHDALHAGPGRRARYLRVWLGGGEGGALVLWETEWAEVCASALWPPWTPLIPPP